MLFISKTIEFDAAHRLPKYDGPCNRPHGHRWKLEMTIRRPDYDTNPITGMVLDFKDLSGLLKKHVHMNLDHYDVNEIIENPTAENMIIWIRDILQNNIGEDIKLIQLKLWETPDSCCTWMAESEGGR